MQRAHPLLERVRFLSISASNLDEFFMVRVAGLKAHQVLGVEERSADGLTPGQQLTAIIAEADRLVASQHEVWDDLRDALAAARACSSSATSRSTRQAEAWLDQYFREQIFPLLTPQAIDPAHPFPFIPNRGFSLIFEIRKGKAAPVRELLMLPVALPRFIRMPGEESRYIALETLIRRKTDYLFPRYDVLRGGAFRIMRDSDIEIEEEAEDLVRYFRTAIKRRRRGRVVRLELEPDMAEGLVRVVKDGRRRGATRSSPKPAASSAWPTWRRWSRRTAPTSSSRRSTRAFPSASASMAAIASRRSATRTSSSTTRTKASRWWSNSSSRRRPTPTSWRSSRRCTAPASSRRSSAR